MAKKIIRVKLKSRLTIVDYKKVFRSLILCGEKLTEIPNNIGNYGDLELVRLTANSLDSLPQSIGNLGNLIELHVNCNYLISLPDSISNLVKLKMGSIPFFIRSEEINLMY